MNSQNNQLSLTATWYIMVTDLLDGFCPPQYNHSTTFTNGTANEKHH